MKTQETTRQILAVLEREARTAPEQLAVMLGLSEQEVREEIARLERDRVILKRKTIINWERTGEEKVAALIEVKVSPQRDVGFESIAARIARFPEARSVYLVSGTYDLAVQVVGPTMRDVAGFVSSKLAPLDGVQATVTHFLLKRYKEDGELLEGDEEAERLPLTP